MSSRFKLKILSAPIFLIAVATTFFASAVAAPAEERVEIKYSRQEIEEKWRARIQSFLDKDVIPIIDLESFWRRQIDDQVVEMVSRVMDELGVALISFSGGPVDERIGRYRWGYHIHELVNAHPDRFILTTNMGSNRNWWAQRGGRPKDYIDQLERHVRGGDYPFIGEIEFRHYMSHLQCKTGKTHRDIDLPLNGPNGHRVFRLSSETGVPFSIHHEPEDHALAALEEMLAAYPKAKVIVAHFGLVRDRERMKMFVPELVTRLLATYPNLYFDLASDKPGARYKCAADRPLNMVIWDEGWRGRQTDTVRPVYRKILTKFSTHFVAGLDFGSGLRLREKYLRSRISLIRLITRDLPDKAKHDIGYRNAWKLLTGKDWRSPHW
jgi:hypothetical protein